MSKNEVRENLFTKYLEPQKTRATLFKSLKTSKKSGKSLDDFYEEVKAKKSTYGVENVYFGKNALEIELMMMQNRKRIESQYQKK